MNAVLLGGACLGALAVFLTTPPEKIAAAQADAQQRGWMERHINIDPVTGEKEETSILAFKD